MTRALLDPSFTRGERRWAACLAAAVWLASASLLTALVVWTVVPLRLG